MLVRFRVKQNYLTGFKDCCQKAKARIWSQLSYVCQIRSTAEEGRRLPQKGAETAQWRAWVPPVDLEHLRIAIRRPFRPLLEFQGVPHVKLWHACALPNHQRCNRNHKGGGETANPNLETLKQHDRCSTLYPEPPGRKRNSRSQTRNARTITGAVDRSETLVRYSNCLTGAARLRTPPASLSHGS